MLREENYVEIRKLIEPPCSTLGELNNAKTPIETPCSIKLNYVSLRSNA